MKDTILYNVYLLVASISIIIVTAILRIADGTAPFYLVFLSIAAVFGIAMAISNIRHTRRLTELARRATDFGSLTPTDPKFTVEGMLGTKPIKRNKKYGK